MLETTVRYSPEQNGAAERLNRTLLDKTPHNCVSPPHSQLIDTCATPFRAPDPAIMLTDTMMPLCRIVPASYQEYPKYMPGICSSTPDLFNAASSANLLHLLPL
ncbi:hypothetical protein CHLNCDRAFT_51454 [Chlorella variabilis]|uniref:Integrase catalytic domain-containing protein n=1 Tax=Chlorella variabilis TaxID=554065 RepID=E1ZBT2_CHLVA|nr:hypothetical protein CHLNCDRAFT_51454 [Chlorella variabilis]EFN56694.1 hypothetical protein CHLNCDRAFT_51454 [Chlorella variabilis]|eukprot:XP_005848796.1 hypothetical protein CHLNCDRAFT_51454 [Chlorella variabilis]